MRFDLGEELDARYDHLSLDEIIDDNKSKDERPTQQQIDTLNEFAYKQKQLLVCVDNKHSIAIGFAGENVPQDIISFVKDNNLWCDSVGEYADKIAGKLKEIAKVKDDLIK